MASTYSNLKIELIGIGDQSGTWGNTTNTNLGTALEEAITGSASVTFSSADVTLTLTDTNTSQTARNLRLNLTGTSGGARSLTVPAIEKQYIVKNNCADTITVKCAGGVDTGVGVPTGKSMILFNDGVNVTEAVTYASATTYPGAGIANSTGSAWGTSYTTTGSGTVVALATSPSFTTPILGTPTSGNFSTGTFTWPTFNQNTTGTAAAWTTSRTLAGNSVNGTANVAFSNKFIVQGTTDAGLSGAQFLGALSTGIVKNTTTTGVLSIATAGTDYQAAITATGILKGAGSGSISAATAGTDYVAPGTATTFTAKQTFTGSTSTLSSKFINALEAITVSATAATGTINYDVTTQSVLYYTTNASANWTVNFRASSGASLDSVMATGESITVVFLVTQGATAYYNNAITVDSVSVTPKWQNGTAPTAGNASSIDAYSYTIVKTGSAAFTVFASQVQFK